MSEVKTTLRYVVTMGAGWLVDFIVFVLLVDRAGIPVAQLVARIAGAITGFLLHKTYTFRVADSGRAGREVAGYVAVWLFAYFLSTGLLLGFVQLGAPTLVAKVAVECLIVPLNYLLLRRFVFRRA